MRFKSIAFQDGDAQCCDCDFGFMLVLFIDLFIFYLLLFFKRQYDNDIFFYQHYSHIFKIETGIIVYEIEMDLFVSLPERLHGQSWLTMYHIRRFR